MKKFIVLALALILVVSFSFAQSVNQVAPIAGSVLVNTATVTHKVQVTSGLSGIIIQSVITKNSGTGAGTAQLQISNDGVNFVNSGSAFTITDVTTQSTTFSVVAPVAGWVQVLYTGSGTENITIKTYYRAPKYQPTP